MRCVGRTRADDPVLRCRLWATSQAPEPDVAKVAAHSGLDCLVEHAGPYYAGFADEYATRARPRNPGVAGTRVMWIFAVASLRCSRSRGRRWTGPWLPALPPQARVRSAPCPPRRPRRRGGSSAEVLDRVAGDRWASRGFVGRDGAHRGGTHGTDLLTGVIPGSFQRQVRSADLPEHLILAVVPEGAVLAQRQDGTLSAGRDATFVQLQGTSEVYVIAGGAPLYVSTCSAIRVGPPSRRTLTRGTSPTPETRRPT